MAESIPKTSLVAKAYAGSEVDKDLSPVIFLHAMLCSKEIWEDIPQRIADATKRRVYVYDARNHGENEHSEEFSFNQNVDDLFQFMKEINADKAVLVGHSMGGVTAIRAALKEPSKVEKLVSVEMYVKELPNYLIGRVINFVNEWKKAVSGLPAGTELNDVTSKSVEALYKALPPDQQLQPEKESYLKSKFLYNQKNGEYDVKFNASAIVEFLGKYEKVEGKVYEDFKASGKQSDMPAFFIYASDSHYKIQSEAESIKKYFPKAELVEIKGASHFIFVEQPTKFTEELVKCLQK